MARALRSGLVALLTVGLVSLGGSAAHAAGVDPGDPTTELTADRSTYSPGEIVTLVARATNTTMLDITGASLSLSPPAGFELVRGP